MIYLKHRVLVYCLSILLIGLPLNTVFVQFFVVNLGLPVWLALWKELLAGIVVLICLFDIYLVIPLFRGQAPKSLGVVLRVLSERMRKNWDILPLILVALMTLVGLVNSIGKVGLNYVIYGFRFELFWVWFWVLLAYYTSLNSSEVLVKFTSKKLLYSVLIGFGISAIFSLVTIFVGSEQVFGFLGYGKIASQTGSELLFTQPVGHLIDAGGWNSDFRLSGTFSSPNHYAAYLLLLLPLFLIGILNVKNTVINVLARWQWGCFLILDLVFICLTYSRFSYLGLLVFGSCLSILYLFKKLCNSFPKLKSIFIVLKNLSLSLSFVLPLIISIFILNLPISTLDLAVSKYHFPTFLSKPSSTEWHQQHTAAAWRTLTLQIYPETFSQQNSERFNQDSREKLENIQAKSRNPVQILYKQLSGYGIGSTDPASKYLPLEQNPIVKLGFGLDDELYFARVLDRPLALTPENWFLGLWVKGGIFYMLLFMAILAYFMRHIVYVFQDKIWLDTPFFIDKTILKILISLSFFSLGIGAFLLDIFDSQSFALCIGCVYTLYSFLLSDFTQNEKQNNLN